MSGVKTDQVSASPEQIARAAGLLAEGEVVAFPTETVYGLGGDAFNPKAIERIFAVKGRPADNPLIVHIASRDDLRNVAESHLSPVAEILAAAFWPGPLTLILPAQASVPAIVRAGLPTVAVRMPSHGVAMDLIRAFGGPIAAPSANRSGRPSPTDADAVFEDLNGWIPLILDDGDSAFGLESTVVDVTSDPPVLLRPGAISRQDIEALVGPLDSPSAESAKRSPGMRYRHYAPSAPVHVVDVAEPNVVLARLARLDPHGTGRIAIMAPDAVLEALPARYRWRQALGANATDAARELFRGLRRLDRAHPDAIVVVWEDGRGLGEAVLNRARKAEGADQPVVLFVCTGNTCRSAMAEALWNRSWPTLRATSAGISARPGPAAAPAIRASAALGADLKTHRARSVVDVMESARMIVTMTRDQAGQVKALRPDWEGRVASWADWIHSPVGDIGDPYGGSDAEYFALARQMDRLLVDLRQVVGERMSNKQ